MPYSLEAEQSVLGSILIDAERITEVAGTLTSEDFYLDEHKEIYLAMQEMFGQDRKIDIVTLIDILVKRGVNDRDRNMEYLKVIADIVPSASNVRDYVRIVRNKSILRKLIGACEMTLDEAYGESDDVQMILDRAEQRVYDVNDEKNSRGFMHISDVLTRTLEQLKLIQDNPGDAAGTPTGFAGVDNFITGLGKGDLCIVGARPGMGKTAFATGIALNVAKNTGKRVCIFSLEMSNEQVVQRMLSGEAQVDGKKMRSGRLDPDDWTRLATASAALAQTDIYIDDSTETTASAMKAKLRRNKENLGLVVVDYIGLMKGEKKTDNRSVEVGDISRNLKIMAKELSVPLIVCAQLNRGTEGRTDKRPTMSDLRESGAIEQDADEILLIYRQEYYNKDNSDGPSEGDAPLGENIAEIIVAKNRHGAMGTAQVGWYKDFAKFTSIENRYDEH